MKKKNKYHKGQHQLICELLECSPSRKGSGKTAYEEVCLLLEKISESKKCLERSKCEKAKIALDILNDEEFYPAY